MAYQQARERIFGDDKVDIGIALTTTPSSSLTTPAIAVDNNIATTISKKKDYLSDVQMVTTVNAPITYNHQQQRRKQMMINSNNSLSTQNGSSSCNNNIILLPSTTTNGPNLYTHPPPFMPIRKVFI